MSLLARARELLPSSLSLSSQSIARVARSSSPTRAVSASPAPLPSANVSLLNRATQLRESADVELRRAEAEEAVRAAELIEQRRTEQEAALLVAQRAAAALVPPRIPPYVPTACVGTLLPSLDKLLACQPLYAADAAETVPAVPLSSQEQVRGRGGMRPGTLLEVTGPPASGKTALLLAMAVNVRVQSLLREAEVRRKGQEEMEVRQEGEAQAVQSTWESMAEKAEQALIIGELQGGRCGCRAAPESALRSLQIRKEASLHAEYCKPLVLRSPCFPMQKSRWIALHRRQTWPRRGKHCCKPYSADCTLLGLRRWQHW